MPELTCTHEEADTRLLLHAAHAAQLGYREVVIRSPDTDVAVLAMSYSGEIHARIFFRTGVKNRARFVDLNLLAESMVKQFARHFQSSMP